MQIARFVVMTLTVILVVTLGSQSAFAHTTDIEHTEKSFSFDQHDFVFKIKNIIEDIRLKISSGQDKIELIKEFALDKQTRIDTALARGETVSLAIEERRTDILDKIDKNSGAVSNGVFGWSVPSEIVQLGEMNQIRILYSNFDECTTSCSEIEKEQFNEKVNSLDTWQKKCTGTFDIHDYALTDSSLDRLSNVCPDLNKYSKNHLSIALSGKI